MPDFGRIIRKLSGLFGSTIRDSETGEVLGKVFVVPWKGRIHFIGYTGVEPLRPVAIPTERISYWKMTLGFTGPREPDSPNIRDESAQGSLEDESHR